MVARGISNMEYFNVINFKVRQEKKVISNYEQETQKKYGFQGILLK